MYNAFLVLFKAIMRNGREEKIDKNDGKRKDVNGGSAAAEDSLMDRSSKLFSRE